MLALVIPTVEESASLPSLLNRVREALESTGTPFEILVVDDDSRDCTAQLVGAIAAEDPRVRLLVRKGERGLSGAILHGWQNTQAEILGVMDADLQHPPELLPQLLAAVLNGCHLAIGSRYTGGGSPGQWNPLRRWISAVAVAMTWPLQPRGMRVKDPMSGFFLVRRSCLDNVAFQSTGFKLLLEILVRARVRSVREIPMVFGKRRAGASKATPHVAWDYGLLLAKLYGARARNQRVTTKTATE